MRVTGCAHPLDPVRPGQTATLPGPSPEDSKVTWASAIFIKEVVLAFGKHFEPSVRPAIVRPGGCLARHRHDIGRRKLVAPV